MDNLSFKPDDFVMFLESAGSEEEQQKGAAKLVSELEKISNRNTRACYLTKYRKAVSNSKRLSATAAQQVLKRLRFPRQFWVDRARQTNGALDDKLRNARLLTDVDGMLQTADRLLDSKNAQEIMNGLSLATGRRFIETLKGTLEDPKDLEDHKDAKENEVMFSGQVKVKGKKDLQPYLIPLLLPKERVLRAWARLREMKPKWASKQTSNRAVTNTVSKIANRETQKNFEKFGLTQFKDLRAAYAKICYERFARNSPLQETKYYSSILGHTHKDNKTGLFYNVFKIVSK